MQNFVISAIFCGHITVFVLKYVRLLLQLNLAFKCSASFSWRSNGKNKYITER